MLVIGTNHRLADMNILYSIGDEVNSSVYDFANRKGLPIDLNVKSHCNFASFLAKLSTHDCVIVESIHSFQMSMLELLKTLKIAASNSIRIISADGRIDIRTDQKAREFLNAFSLACEIDSSYRSSKTKRALAISKQNGKVLGRRVGWRKNHITEKAAIIETN